MNHKILVCESDSKKARVYLFDTLGFWGNTAREIAAQIDSIPQDYDIEIAVCSNGGEYSQATAMCNLIAKRKDKVTCVNYGMAASMASVVLLAGGNVLGYKNSVFMVHNPRWIMNKNPSSSDEKYTEIAASAMCDAYCAKTGMKPEDVRGMMENETYLSADECKKMGFYDGVIEDDTVTASMNFKQILAQANPNGGGIAANPPTMKGHKMTKLLNALAGAKLIASADLPEDAATAAFQASHATLVAQITNLQKENGDLKTAIEASKKSAVDAHVQAKVDAKIIGAELKPKWVSAILASPDAQGLLDAMQAPQANIPAPVPSGEGETKVEAKTEKELRAQLETEQHPAKRFVIAKQLRELTTKK